MGYACPVCGEEQADAAHLANHLAITASLDREDHREWLEDHAPDWADSNPEELGEIVSQYAPETETPEFERPNHDHDHGRPGGLEAELARQGRQPGRGAMTNETERVLEEARELTRRMQEPSDDGGAETDRDSGGEEKSDDDTA